MTDAADDLGPVPIRIPVEVGLVQRLIDEQFPQWTDLEIRPVDNGGWDNWTFHLGDELSVRLPSAAPYALAVEKEHRWLPILRPQLSLPISTPVGLGRPGQGYPFAWSVYRWLPGTPARTDNIGESADFGAALADFLRALQQVDPTGGPEPGVHNWFRGGSLATYGDQVERALSSLGSRVPADLINRIWQQAMNEMWDGRPVWFHGDVAAGNLLVENGSLTAVIDFGTCGIGDPACDLAIAWTLLPTAGREHFRAGLDVDDGTWARGRGWALWKTLASYAYAVEDQDPEAEYRRILDEIITEYQSSSPGDTK